jgi:hypothetical protein
MKLQLGQEMSYLESKKRLADCRAFPQDVKGFDPRFGNVWSASGLTDGTAPSGRVKHPKPNGEVL